MGRIQSGAELNLIKTETKMEKSVMYKVYAEINYIGNDNIDSFDDFIEEIAMYDKSDLWLVSYHECSIDEDMKEKYTKIKNGIEKDMRIIYCENTENAKNVIEKTFESFGGSEPAPESGLIMHIKELTLDQFESEYEKVFKEDDMDNGRYWTKDGWVEE